MQSHAEIGRQSARQRNWEEAVIHLERALREVSDPWDPSLLLPLARARIGRGAERFDPTDLDRAEVLLGGLLERTEDLAVRSECRGFLGRIAKQRFMSLPGWARPAELHLLEKALDWYGEPGVDPAQLPYWRHLNLVHLATVRTSFGLDGAPPLANAARIGAEQVELLERLRSLLTESARGADRYWLLASLATTLALRASWLRDEPRLLEQAAGLLEQATEEAPDVADLDSTLRTFCEIADVLGAWPLLQPLVRLQSDQMDSLGAPAPRRTAGRERAADLASGRLTSVSERFGRGLITRRELLDWVDLFDSIAVVESGNGAIKASGVLVGSRTLLTCRHVVDGAEDVGGFVAVFRPWQRGASTPLRILPRGWRLGVGAGHPNDWALVPLDASPAEVQPQAWQGSPTQPAVGRSVVALHYSEGLEAQAALDDNRIVEVRGTGAGCVFTCSGTALPGSSGGAVVDRSLRHLLGMTSRALIAKGSAEGLPPAEAIPISAIQAQLPQGYTPE